MLTNGDALMTALSIHKYKQLLYSIFLTLFQVTIPPTANCTAHITGVWTRHTHASF